MTKLDTRDPATWPQFLTAEDVAEVLSLHLLTVRLMLRDGRLPGRQLGRVWRVNKQALIDFIDTRAQE